MRESTKAVLKILKVIESCETLQHTFVAEKLIHNFEVMFATIPQIPWVKNQVDDYYNDITLLNSKLISKRNSIYY